MIKTLVAHTLEIDDADLAVREVLSQLDPDRNLLKHSAGLISCYSEFIDSGVVKAISDALDFPVVGATTNGNCDNEEISHMMLVLMVLTSDDIEFSAAFSESLLEDCERRVADAYERARAALPGEPGLMLSFVPLIQTLGGDRVVALLDAASGGVPNFGTVVCDHTDDYHTAQSICGGEASVDKTAILLLSGDIEPTFVMASISDERVIKQRAVITKSQGNLLIEVNNMPTLKYLNSLGLQPGATMNGLNSIPFMVDSGDGKLLARAMFAITEDGAVVCGAAMPEGATLAVGSLDYEDVMLTTKGTLEVALRAGKNGGMIMFSCLSRYLSLGVDTHKEMELVQRVLPGDMSYYFAYSGGEVCPIYVNGKPVNRFHNVTLVACVF